MKNNLMIDPEFKALIPPLSNDDYELLERSILIEGCHDAIVVWNGIIIDGYNRYSICKKHGIPYQTRTASFEDRDEALVWACQNQLKRRNISAETRKYLIGKRYYAEKRIVARNPNGNNQYKVIYPQNEDRSTLMIKKHGIADELSAEYNISHSSVERYEKYAKAVDRIMETSAHVIPGILSGTLQITHNDLLGIATLSDTQINAVLSDIPATRPYALTRDEIICKLRDTPKETLIPEKAERSDVHTQTVKDMPAYDPDAEVSSLYLTIPSWKSTIQRVKCTSNMRCVSDKAKLSLRQELISLIQTVEQMLKTIQEEASDGS